jgi:hypothetical protein
MRTWFSQITGYSNDQEIRWEKLIESVDIKDYEVACRYQGLRGGHLKLLRCIFFAYAADALDCLYGTAVQPPPSHHDVSSCIISSLATITQIGERALCNRPRQTLAAGAIRLISLRQRGSSAKYNILPRCYMVW